MCQNKRSEVFAIVYWCAICREIRFECKLSLALCLTFVRSFIQKEINKTITFSDGFSIEYLNKFSVWHFQHCIIRNWLACENMAFSSREKTRYILPLLNYPWNFNFKRFILILIFVRIIDRNQTLKGLIGILFRIICFSFVMSRIYAFFIE